MSARLAEVIDESSHYDRVAHFYDRAIRPVERIVDRKRRCLLAQAKGQVLEIGVGTGRTLHLYPRGIRLTGIDPSERMLELARQRARELRIPAELRAMQAENLDFPDASFDTVVSSLTLCSVSDLMRTLAEIRRVLRPNGQLFMVEHVRPAGALGWLFDRADPWYSRLSCHLNRPTPDCVRLAGFQVIEDERWLRGIFLALQART